MKPQNLVQKALAASVAALSALALTAPSSLAAKDNYHITNKSRTPIAALYLTESSVATWGDDLLGYDLLLGGESRSVRFGNPSPYACLYDIRVIFADGSFVDALRVNVCSSNGHVFW